MFLTKDGKPHIDWDYNTLADLLRVAKDFHLLFKRLELALLGTDAGVQLTRFGHFRA